MDIKHLLITGILLIGITVDAQDLESVGKEKPFRVNGGLSLNQVGYYQWGAEDARRDPYTYIASGNINFNIYGWSVPLSFTYSNLEGTFQQPFNEYGLTPSYKWAKAYIGYNAINFSKYTVSNYRFLGGGLEVTPGNFNTTIFYGRLQKPVEYDSLNQNNIMAYERMGYGIKSGYTFEKGAVDLIAFHARDDSSSLSNIPTNAETTPAENTVLGINAGVSPLKNLSLQAEYANSAYTSDVRSPEATTTSGLTTAGHFLTPRASTAYYHAINSSLSYAFDKYSLGVAYERVDPEYHTLGAYYTTNDLENISLNGSSGFYEGKLGIQVNAGLQRNDLDGQKASKMSNLVGSASVNAALNEKINLSGSYSNYRSYTNIKTQFDYINQTKPWENLDTLDFTQLTQNASVNASFGLGDHEERKQTLTSQLSFQDASEQQGYYQANAGSQFYNANMGYAVNFVPIELNLSFTTSASYVTSPLNNSLTLGPVVSVNKAFFEGTFNNGMSITYNQSHTDGALQNTVVSTRYNVTYLLKEKHNFSFSGIYFWQDSRIYASGKLSEVTLTLTYSYSF